MNIKNKGVESFCSSEDNDIIDINAEVVEAKYVYDIKQAQLLKQNLQSNKENKRTSFISKTVICKSKEESNLNEIKGKKEDFSNDKIKIENDYIEDCEEMIDEDAYKQICSIVESINQQNIIHFKNLLIEKQNENQGYFKTNYYIKDGFFKIYSFLKNNTHLNDQFSCFFTFKELLNTISHISLYLKVFSLSKEQLNEDENQFSQTCASIIEEQMKQKKTVKNRKVNHKRKLKEIEKRKALGLHYSKNEKERDFVALGIKRKREQSEDKQSDDLQKKREEFINTDDIENDSSNII